MRAKEFLNKTTKHTNLSDYIIAKEQELDEATPFTPLDQHDIEYLRSLKKFSAEARVGQQYMPLLIMLFSEGPAVHGDTALKTLVKIGKKGQQDIYVFEDEQKHHYSYPGEHITKLSYATPFLFENKDSYEQFKTAMHIKFDVPLPESAEFTDGYPRVVTEIERTRASDYPGGGAELLSWGSPAIQSKFKQGSKPLPGGSKFNYYVEKNIGPGYEIFILDTEEDHFVIVGHLSLSTATRWPTPAVQVDTITVHEDYRAQGLATALYGIVLSILKLTLLAGGVQTPGGRKNWLRLASIPGVEVKGYVQIDDREFDNPQQYQRHTRTMIDKLMAAGGEYIGRAGLRHCFAFDVVPGTGELETAAKNTLKLYHTDRANIFPGLMAQWTGR